MQKLSEQDKKKISLELQKQWYDKIEIEKIFQAHKEMLEGKYFSSEEVFEHLLQTKIEYA